MTFYDRNKFKLTGHDEPRKENRILLWGMIALLVFTLFYILSFYFQ
jgi:hypothetical protein